MGGTKQPRSRGREHHTTLRITAAHVAAVIQLYPEERVCQCVHQMAVHGSARNHGLGSFSRTAIKPSNKHVSAEFLRKQSLPFYEMLDDSTNAKEVFARLKQETTFRIHGYALPPNVYNDYSLSSTLARRRAETQCQGAP
jgi:hypothetical protein